MVVSFLRNKSAVAVVAVLCGATSARASVAEIFHLSGNLYSVFGASNAFAGTLVLDFSSDFSAYTVQSLQVSVHGRSVFKTGVSIGLGASKSGSIQAINSANDWLSFNFTTPNAGSWDGFEQGAITSGLLVFGGNTGALISANGLMSRDLSGPAIEPPPLVIDPPPIIDPPVPVTSAAVPELSTWAMTLVGFVGLGLLAKRRAFRSPVSRA